MNTHSPAADPGRHIGLLQDKVAVITGAGVAEGIGATCAALFVREGAQVLVADISGAQDDTAAGLGTSAAACPVDVSREDDVEAMFAEAVRQFGRVDVLVNVAGNPGGRRGAEVTVEEYESLTAVHLRGTFLTNKHAVRAMLSVGGGAIVNFSSAASFNVDALISPVYSAAKAGVNAITKSVAAQYGPHGIRANAVAPGFTLSKKNQSVPENLGRLVRQSRTRPGRTTRGTGAGSGVLGLRPGFVRDRSRGPRRWGLVDQAELSNPWRRPRTVPSLLTIRAATTHDGDRP